MPCEFEENVFEYVKARSLFTPGDKILIAVSGGADSIALLYCLYNLKSAGAINNELICAHLNHQLRASESDNDEKFVTAQAGSLGLKIIKRNLYVREFAQNNKLSIETAARQLRIESLLDIAEQTGCKIIAAGHQKNDNAETIIQRLLRGTGYRGLAGIWPKKNIDNFTFVRPLLRVTRDEIIEYLNSRNLKWRLDATNYQYIYRRNFLRHKLIPELQKNCKDSLIEVLSGLSQAAYRLHHNILRRTKDIWPQIALAARDTIKLDLVKFIAQPQPVQVELIRFGLKELKIGERDFTEQHYNNILALAGKNVSNKFLELPDGLKAFRQYSQLVLAIGRIPEIKNLSQASVELNIPGNTNFADYNIEAAVVDFNERDFEKFKTDKDSFVEWFDLDKLSMPLTARTRQKADSFTPLGLNAEKKVGQFLTNAKIPLHLRGDTFVIADEQKIIWVCPIRTSGKTKVTSCTKKILQLRLAKNN